MSKSGSGLRHERARGRALAERGRDARDRWQENGFRSLDRSQKRFTVLAVVVVAVLVASLLVATVRSVVVPTPDKEPASTAGGDPGDEAPALAAAVSIARLVSSDRGRRVEAYVENVDPDITSELQESFESGVMAILEATGAGDDAVLATVPLGYQVDMNDGRLVSVRLWVRQETGADGTKPDLAYQVMDVLMRWNGERWLLYAYIGSERGPKPGDVAADSFVPLPSERLEQ